MSEMYENLPCDRANAGTYTTIGKYSNWPITKSTEANVLIVLLKRSFKYSKVLVTCNS